MAIAVAFAAMLFTLASTEAVLAAMLLALVSIALVLFAMSAALAAIAAEFAADVGRVKVVNKEDGKEEILVSDYFV